MGAFYLALAVLLAGTPLDAVFAAPTVDIKANGQDGTVTINDGDSFSYSWTTNNATACQLTDPGGESGIDLNGNGGPIPSDHPWYPSVGNPTTLTLDCTDGVNSESDFVVINVVAGGGGGGSSIDADIKANGSNGPVTITQGDSWVYSWTSSSATACQLTAPGGESGVDLNGNGGPIPADHPWYPSIGNPTTLTLDCTDGVNSESDFVVINVVAGGGGG
ncbi:MAG: hypothetical protein NUV78_01130, partial [Candidatus Zambryskibacteria bacterium]|nr:hypothetical protein [Candidatus Zambryskibacteria bacterium]